ncbi:hypothetical protein EDD15DRAFT_2371288 [Pisolithus albus]|nr:hypothetical protein EDD15DRAFT_2371288 [Pisolithus albus]
MSSQQASASRQGTTPASRDFSQVPNEELEVQTDDLEETERAKEDEKEEALQHEEEEHRRVEAERLAQEQVEQEHRAREERERQAEEAVQQAVVGRGKGRVEELQREGLLDGDHTPVHPYDWGSGWLNGGPDLSGRLRGVSAVG